MASIEEKRVYGDRAGAAEAYVSCAVGVVRVRVADAAVGEFGLVERCDARDVAADPTGSLAVATADDVLVAAGRGPDASDSTDAGDRSAPGEADAAFEPTDFGPAVAVGYDDGTLLAAAPDGAVARREDDSWERLDSPGAAVRAIDGDLVGTDDGVFLVRGDGLVAAGLGAARDVSAAGVPLAAAESGLYRLSNGWMRVLDGPVDAVSADPRSDPGTIDRAHAAAGSTLYGYAPEPTADDASGRSTPTEGAWRPAAEASARIVAVDHGETVVAATETGSVLALGSDGPRSRSIGVADVTGLALRRGRPDAG